MFFYLHGGGNGAKEEVMGEIASSDSGAIGEKARFSHTIANSGSYAHTKRKK
mgnify:CR=1 FL=1